MKTSQFVQRTVYHQVQTDYSKYRAKSNIAIRAETWVLTLGGYGATVPDKLGGALGSPDENYRSTIKLLLLSYIFKTFVNIIYKEHVI